jgi:hypothetical protein
MRSIYDPRPLNTPSQGAIDKALANPKSASLAAGAKPGDLCVGRVDTHGGGVVHTLKAIVFQERSGNSFTYFLAWMPDCGCGHNARAYAFPCDDQNTAITCKQCTR